MPLSLRILFIATRVLLTSVGALAFIAAFDTWRFYSLELALAIPLEVASAAIGISGVLILSVGLRYRDPRNPKNQADKMALR